MNKQPIVYLDNNSTTELSHEVSGILMDIVINSVYGNPSSGHSIGGKMRALVESSRFAVANSLGCMLSEVVFTSGGTESNNLAIRGVYNTYSDQYNDIVISAAEHSSVHNTCEAVASGRLRIIPLLPDGSLDLEWADRLITEDTTLVSVMLANNEIGSIFPIKEVVKIAHSRGALVHCDAVQAYGKMPIDVKELGVDLLSISGHKIHAMPGVGALYVRKGVQLHPLFSGGKQELGLRPGTENYIAITSLGTMAEELSKEGYSPSSGLRDAFERALLKRIPNIKINAKDTDRVYNTSSVVFQGVNAGELVKALEASGVYVSAGSACSSGQLKPSRTLKAIGLSDEEALSTIRFSFSQFSSMSDATSAIDACVKCVNLLRGQSPE